MRIYVAGPLGFSEAGRSFHNGFLIPAIVKLAHEIFDPWATIDSRSIERIEAMPHGPARQAAWEHLNYTIAEINTRALDECDAVVAVLDGADVDSGTAAEIGYAFAKKKPVLGYRSDFRLAADNEGCRVNLQVEYFIRKSGCAIIQSIAELPEHLNRLAASLKPQCTGNTSSKG